MPFTSRRARLLMTATMGGPAHDIKARTGAGDGLENTLKKPIGWTMLSLAFMTPAVSASELASLLDLPVIGTTLVPAAQYRDALPRAAGTGSPVDVALGVTGPFEGARQLIAQVNEGTEAPSASRVIVIRDGLLDDAVRTERWDIAIVRTAAGTWEVSEVRKAWRCWRGASMAGFAAQPCP